MSTVTKQSTNVNPNSYKEFADMKLWTVLVIVSKRILEIADTSDQTLRFAKALTLVDRLEEMIDKLENVTSSAKTQ